MATNADEEEVETLDTSEEDLRKAKEESETNPETKEPAPSEEEPTKGEESPAKEQSKAPLTTEIPDEKDLDWYKKAYEQSTKEALRLKGELDKKPETSPAPVTETKTDTVDPDKLYLEHLRTKDLSTVWTAVLGDYPQLADPNGDAYKKFVQRANVMGRTILEDEKRYVEPSELYPMVISSLGLNKGDDQDRLGAALKDGGATPKINSGSPQKPTQSKVTDSMVAANMRMYPNKTRQEIIEELEDYVQ